MDDLALSSPCCLCCGWLSVDSFRDLGKRTRYCARLMARPACERQMDKIEILWIALSGALRELIEQSQTLAVTTTAAGSCEDDSGCVSPNTNC